MFPTANSTVYYNEAGEPLGWSDESYYEPDPDDYQYSAADAAAEDAWEQLLEMDDDELGERHEVAEGAELGSIHDAMSERDLVFIDPGCEDCARRIAAGLCSVTTGGLE
jgi:hypothetical protein